MVKSGSQLQKPGGYGGLQEFMCSESWTIMYMSHVIDLSITTVLSSPRAPRRVTVQAMHKAVRGNRVSSLKEHTVNRNARITISNEENKAVRQALTAVR